MYEKKADLSKHIESKLKKEDRAWVVKKGDRAKGFESCMGCINVDVYDLPCKPGNAQTCIIAAKRAGAMDDQSHHLRSSDKISTSETPAKTDG